MIIRDDGRIRALTSVEIATLMTEAGDKISSAGVRYILKRVHNKIRDKFGEDFFNLDVDNSAGLVAHRRNKSRSRLGIRL